MAAIRNESGNKMSFRSSAMDQIKRVPWISKNLGVLGDMLTSTFKSILFAAIVAALPVVVSIPLAFQSCDGANAGKNVIFFVLSTIGSIMLGLNILMINPSQGSQLKVSFKFISRMINDSHMKELQDVKPYRFYRNDRSKATLESRYKRKRRYTSIFQVQGAISRTSFEDDLVQLRNLQRDLMKTMQRDTVRTTINYIGVPKIKRKVVAENATPEMKARAYDLANVINDLGDMQVLKTYIVLNSNNPRNLQKEVDNHMHYFGKGLTVTAKLLAGDELKRTMMQLFS